MVPNAPKRPSPDKSSDDGQASPKMKKRRTDSNVLQTPPADSPVGVVDAEDVNKQAGEELPAVVPSENEEMDITLKRSLALALRHVGFDSASPESLDSMALLVESYTSRLLSNIQLSMTTCRRTIPIPQDYDYAFERMQIPAASLVPHKKLPPGLPSSSPRYRPRESLDLPPVDQTSEVVPALSGARDKASKRYIPKKFPIFPAQYTYKFTTFHAVVPETDPTIIRERAAAERRQAEHLAHLRLDQDQRNQGQHVAHRNQTEKCKMRDQLWEKLVIGVSSSSGGETGEGRFKRVAVNAAKKYHRHVVRTGIKKQPMVEKSGSSVGTLHN